MQGEVERGITWWSVLCYGETLHWQADKEGKVCWGVHVGATGVEWGSKVDVDEMVVCVSVSCVVTVMSGPSDASASGLTKEGDVVIEEGASPNDDSSTMRGVVLSGVDERKEDTSDPVEGVMTVGTSAGLLSGVRGTGDEVDTTGSLVIKWCQQNWSHDGLNGMLSESLVGGAMMPSCEAM
jgi:hypothetical protein